MTLNAQNTFKTYLLTLKDGQYIFSLKKAKKKRSLPQNAYYRGVVVPIIGNHLGYEAEEMHRAIAMKFLIVHNDDPKKPPTVRSTADLSTVEFNEFLEKVVRWAAIEFSVVVPDPSEIDL